MSNHSPCNQFQSARKVLVNHGHGEPVDHRWFKTHTWEARRYWEAKPPASSQWARRPWCMWWWFTVGTMLPASGIHICVSRPIRCCSICLVEWPCTGPNQLASLLLSNVYVALVCMILQRSLLCHFTSNIYNYWYVNICDWILQAADLDELWAEPFFHQATLLGPQWLMPSPIPWLGFPTKIRQAGFKNHPTLAVWWEKLWTLNPWILGSPWFPCISENHFVVDPNLPDRQVRYPPSIKIPCAGRSVNGRPAWRARSYCMRSSDMKRSCDWFIKAFSRHCRNLDPFFSRMSTLDWINPQAVSLGYYLNSRLSLNLESTPYST